MAWARYIGLPIPTLIGRSPSRVLPDTFAHHPERLARFDREAKTLAALNHPNIGAIYGLEKSSGRTALVMELVEGPTLADRIAKVPIPLDEAFALAAQIAEALEAAHEQGIIHRDLKPANIKVRPDGTVKVLDFGLAKAMEPVSSAPNVSQSPTITAAMTVDGVILGTAAYMSPEQARGQTVDKRTDIWAFGCVVYEMIGGRSAYGSETIADTVARILEREPDWRALPISTPRSIRDLLRRCLRKDLQGRLRDVAVARDKIDEARAGLSAQKKVVRWTMIAAGAVLALLISLGVWRYSSELGSSVADTSIPAVDHEVVSVILADLQNATNDPAFDRTLEPMLKLALEGAGFINAVHRREIRGLDVDPPMRLDETAAREFALKARLGVVLSGSIEREGNDYRVLLKATRSIGGDGITTAQGLASNKEQVIVAAFKAITSVRQALGDKTSESSQMAELKSLAATPLDAVRQFAAAKEASSNGRFEESVQSFLKAVELDPQFGMAYQGLAGTTSIALGKAQEARSIGFKHSVIRIQCRSVNAGALAPCTP